MNYISSYSIIKNKGITKNGELVFSLDENEKSLDDFLSEAYNAINPNYPKFYKMDHLAKLGFLATEVLLSNFSLEEYQNNIGVVLSNASASLDNDQNYFNSTKNGASPALFVYTLPNIVAGEICIRHKLKGENAFFVFEKFQPEFISAYVNQVLARGANACIAGWTETIGETHDVFLYFAEKIKRENSLEHTKEIVEKIYHQ